MSNAIFSKTSSVSWRIFHPRTQNNWISFFANCQPALDGSPPVDIDDGAEVVQLVEAGKVERLPHTPLHRLTVTQQAVRAVARLYIKINN